MENQPAINLNPGRVSVAPAAAAPAPATEMIDADLDVLIQKGVLERSVEPFKAGQLRDHKITMHTLLGPERVAASREIPNADMATAASAEQAPKIPTLVHSITRLEVGGTATDYANPATKPDLRAKLDRLSSVEIDILYIEYLKMTNDLIRIIETGVKKN